MLGIFDDDRQCPGQIWTNAIGAGSILPPAASRMACGAAKPRRHPFLVGGKIASRRVRNVIANSP